MNARLEEVWFQGILFFLLYWQCADTILDEDQINISVIF